MGEVNGLGRVHAEVEGVGPIDRTDGHAGVAPGAPVVDVAGMLHNRDIEIPGPPRNALDLGQGGEPDLGIILHSLEVDLEAAVRGAKLGEISVELGHPSAQIRLFLDEKDFISGFRRLYGGGDPGDPAADDEYGSVYRRRSGRRRLLVHDSRPRKVPGAGFVTRRG